MQGTWVQPKRPVHGFTILKITERQPEPRRSTAITMDTTEWDAICRICLQEGQMHSIFDFDDEKSDINIARKIAMCSTIEIRSGSNLPEQICTDCLIDLGHAYKFRQNCERSDAILQSFVDSTVENGPECTTDEYDDQNDLGNESASGSGIVVGQESSGSMYEYWPPVGLNVKLVRGDTSKPNSTNASGTVRKRQSETKMNFKTEPLDIYDIDEQEEHLDETMSDSELFISDELNENSENERQTRRKELIDDTDVVSKRVLQQIKPVKTNKARLGLTASNNTASSSTPRRQLKVVRAATSRKSTPSKEHKTPKTCPICGNTYKYQHALDSHMRRHRNEKPFVCSVCDKGFVINFELTRHMRTHTGQKPYACKYCDRRFSDFGSRVKHERTHTGERPYACELCGKTFTYSHVLSSHMLIHTGEKKYHCETCGKRFAKSHHLKAHMNTHNKQNAQKAEQVKMEMQQHRIAQDDDPLTIANDPNDLTEYINISHDDIVTEDDDVVLGGADTDAEGQLLLYTDVDVDTLESTMKAQNIILKRKIGEKPHIIEDENGIQHEITIAEHQDAIELLTFDDDELE